MGDRLDSTEVSASPQRDFLWITLSAVAYFCAYRLAFVFPMTGHIVATIWPAAGVGLAALLLNQRRLWPMLAAVLFVTGLVANTLTGRPFLPAAGFMVANIAESLGCAWLIRRMCGDDVRFEKVLEVVALTLASTCVNACTTFIGAVVAYLAGGEHFWDFWLTWWIADGLGLLLVTPLAILLLTRAVRFSGVRWWRCLELIALLTSLCLVTRLAIAAERTAVFPRPYVLLAFVVWAALRFGQTGTVITMVAMTATAVSTPAIAAGPSPWGEASGPERLLLTQAFIGFLAVTGMLLAAHNAQTIAAERSAREGRARLAAMGDNIPSGLVYQIERRPDGSMRFTYVSAGAEKLLGLSVEQLLSDSSCFYGRIVSEDMDNLLAARRRSAEELAVFNVIVRFRRPDDDLRWIQLSSAPRIASTGMVWDGMMMDMTDQMRAQDAVLESEERYRTLFENAGEGILAADVETMKIAYVNGAGCRLFGYSKDEMCQLSVSDLHPAEAMPRIQANFKAVPTSSGQIVADTQCLRKDGEVFFADIRTAKMVIDGRQVNVGFFTDITERKHALEAVQKSEQLFRAIIENSYDAITLMNRDGTILFSSPSVHRVLGYEPGERIGEKIHDFVIAEDREQMSRIFETLVGRPGETLHYVGRLLHKDGSIRWIEAAGTNLLDDPAVRAIVVNYRDITDKRAAEAEILLLKHAIDVHYDGACWQDVNNNIIYINDSLCSSVGYSRDELMGQNVNLLNPRATPERMADIWRILRENGAFSVESVHRRKDGTLFPVEITSTYVKHDDKEYACGFIRDITDRKKAEMELLLSRARLQAVLDASLDAVTVVDAEGTFLASNVVLEERWGKTREQLVGHLASEVLSPEIFAARMERIRQCIATGQADYFQDRQGDLWYDISISPIKEPDGTIRTVALFSRDITDRKRAEERLLRIQKAVECAGDAIGIADSQGRHFYQNKAFTDLFEYTTEEVNASGVEPAGFVDKKVAREVFSTIMSGGSWNGETEMISRSGRRFSVLLHADAIKDEDGKVIGLVGVHSDITDRKRAEEEIRFRNVILSTQQETAIDGILVVDENSRIVSYNRRFVEMWGIPPELIEKKDDAPVLRFVTGRTADPQQFLQRVLYLYEHKQEKSFDEVAVDDGRVFDRYSSPMLGPDGRYYGRVWYFRDITDRKRAEDALRKKVIALSMPVDDPAGIKFTDLFNIEDIQRIQDEFAAATNVASIITYPDGTPITRQSNFCRLCNEIIRRTGKGLENCYRSDAVIGRQNPAGPIVQPCLSGGLWDAGASITVGGRHIANWLIGQVRNEQLNEERILAYADVIGADREEFRKALAEVPVMSREQFDKVAQALFSLANELSLKAYQNVQQARFITDRKHAEAELKKQMEELLVWHKVTVDREGRVMELKDEVNSLLAKLGLPQRYRSGDA